MTRFRTMMWLWGFVDIAPQLGRHSPQPQNSPKTRRE